MGGGRKKEKKSGPLKKGTGEEREGRKSKTKGTMGLGGKRGGGKTTQSLSVERKKNKGTNRDQEKRETSRFFRGRKRQKKKRS